MSIAIVVPIFKKSNRKALGNYRRMSLLPAFSKIVEKIIKVRLLKLFNVNKVFTSNQFGF